MKNKLYEDVTFADVCELLSNNLDEMDGLENEDVIKQKITETVEDLKPEYDLTVNFCFDDCPVAFELSPNNKETYDKIVESFSYYADYYKWDNENNRLIEIKPLNIKK